MREIVYADERVNRRSLWLRLRSQLWWIPACTLIGALAAAAIYMGIWLGVSGQRQYRQTSKFYLTFAADSAGNAQDYYNDYTWNDLLFSVPAISQVIESELPDGMTMEEAREDIEAQILSDVRLLTIQVTDADAEQVQAVTNAVQDALVRYGHTSETFESIEYLSSGDVESVVVTDRTRNAVILGALLGFLISAAAVWLRELLNDGIYCPEEATRRYGLPVLMTLTAGSAGESAVPEQNRASDGADEKFQKTQKHKDTDSRKGNAAKKKEKHALPGFLEEENRTAAESLRKSFCIESAAVHGIHLLAEDMELAENTAQQLKDMYQLEAEALDPAKVLNAAGESTQNAAAKLLLVVPYGEANGTGTEHLLVQLQARGAEPDGLILAEADGQYLQKYYKKTVSI